MGTTTSRAGEVAEFVVVVSTEPRPENAVILTDLFIAVILSTVEESVNVELS